MTLDNFGANPAADARSGERSFHQAPTKPNEPGKRPENNGAANALVAAIRHGLMAGLGLGVLALLYGLAFVPQESFQVVTVRTFGWFLMGLCFAPLAFFERRVPLSMSWWKRLSVALGAVGLVATLGFVLVLQLAYSQGVAATHTIQGGFDATAQLFDWRTSKWMVLGVLVASTPAAPVALLRLNAKSVWIQAIVAGATAFCALFVPDTLMATANLEGSIMVSVAWGLLVLAYHFSGRGERRLALWLSRSTPRPTRGEEERPGHDGDGEGGDAA